MSKSEEKLDRIIELLGSIHNRLESMENILQRIDSTNEAFRKHNR